MFSRLGTQVVDRQAKGEHVGSVSHLSNPQFLDWGYQIPPFWFSNPFAYPLKGNPVIYFHKGACQFALIFNLPLRAQGVGLD